MKHDADRIDAIRDVALRLVDQLPDNARIGEVIVVAEVLDDTGTGKIALDSSIAQPWAIAGLLAVAGNALLAPTEGGA